MVWNIFYFPYVGNFIIPTDFHSMFFQRGRWLNHQPEFEIYEIDCNPESGEEVSWLVVSNILDVPKYMG